MAGFAATALLVLAGCATTIDQRGNLPDEEKLSEIKPGVTDKESVSRLLGTPSTTATFDGSKWYYISRRTEQFAFLAPTLLDQQVVVVAFDDNGLVRDVRRHGLEDRREVDPVARATPASGKELTILEQLFGNLGKFNEAPKGRPGS